ncbi:AraC family transcriptional regulator [uncultured Roseobacter sp.]|uniref:AraC family transcriptional regulator n=1 Tax=uncultured Roseobacter sp. TaxID=114847 RepID=UPI00261F9C4A|nr:AraC family transcriptional regulator [uncultured Roseobacter sp.]
MTSPQHAAPGQTFDSYAEFYRNSAYSTFGHEHRANGSFGLSMLSGRQDPIDLIDAAVPEFAFVWERLGMDRVSIDIGYGKHIDRAGANSLSVVPPDTEAHFDISTEHEVVGACLPKETILVLLDDYGIDVDVFSRFYAKALPAPRAIAAMDTMWRYANMPGPAASLYLDGATLQFLALAADHASLSPLAPERPEDDRIARVIDYIEARYGEALTIAELAAVACLSPGHFSRTFKATMGDPVWTYVQCRRCERAKEMLLTTGLPIAEIAYRCGFANQSHLTTVFKTQYAASPGVVRQSKT